MLCGIPILLLRPCSQMQLNSKALHHFHHLRHLPVIHHHLNDNHHLPNWPPTTLLSPPSSSILPTSNGIGGHTDGQIPLFYFFFFTWGPPPLSIILSRWRACSMMLASQRRTARPLMRQLTDPCDLIGRDPALRLLSLVLER